MFDENISHVRWWIQWISTNTSSHLQSFVPRWTPARAIGRSLRQLWRLKEWWVVFRKGVLWNKHDSEIKWYKEIGQVTEYKYMLVSIGIVSNATVDLSKHLCFPTVIYSHVVSTIELILVALLWIILSRDVYIYINNMICNIYIYTHMHTKWFIYGYGRLCRSRSLWRCIPGSHCAPSMHPILNDKVT